MTNKITLRHWAFNEGYDAQRLGYSGKNPYHGKPGDAAHWWKIGYVAAISDALDRGERAVPMIDVMPLDQELSAA